jgi:hypothetical protein
MAIKFSIKNTSAKAEKEGDLIVRYSGLAEPFRRSSERQCQEVGVDGAGKAKVVFVTGLDEEKVEMYRWFTKEEKEAVKKLIKQQKTIIAKAYGGTDVVEPTNRYFWGPKNKEVFKLYITNDTHEIFFDLERPSHALLYLSICAGAFIDVVAPNKEWAERHQIPHYLSLETDEVSFDGEEDITRGDAMAELMGLRKETPEALLILAWCLLSETNSFGGMNKATSQKDMLNSFIKYIDGKLVTKKKRNCPKLFIQYAEKWKAPQTRPALYTEAYLKAGEYFALVNQREKKYTTSTGTVLGNTVSEAVDNLMKPKFTVDLETLRDAVEEKWKE